MLIIRCSLICWEYSWSQHFVTFLPGPELQSVHQLAAEKWQQEEEHELGLGVKNVSISRVVAKLFSILRKHSPVLPPVQNKDIRITAKLSPNSWQQDYFNSPSYYNIIMYNGRGNVIHYNLLIAQSIQNFILFLFCSFHILYFYKIIFCCSCFIFLCVLRLHFWVNCALHWLQLNFMPLWTDSICLFKWVW